MTIFKQFRKILDMVHFFVYHSRINNDDQEYQQALEEQQYIKDLEEYEYQQAYEHQDYLKVYEQQLDF